MSEHRFAIGQALKFTPRRLSFGAGPSACKITRLLASEGDEPQYRIKCTSESFERVVHESELR
jgi:hypothetical protein